MNGPSLINWGSYDVDNFGDLLFPFVIEHYLGRHYADVVHVSPTGTPSRWPDACETVTFQASLNRNLPSAIVIGGGNLISWTKSSSVNYREDVALAAVVHPSFFYVPQMLNARYAIPYAINMVGVSKPIPLEGRSAIRSAINQAKYVGVRDQESSQRLRAAGIHRDIAVGLDSAFAVPNVFTKRALSRRYYEEVCPRYGIPAERAVAAIHVKAKYLDKGLQDVNQITAWLNDRSIHPIFLPLGMCHEDEKIFDDPEFRPTAGTVVRSPEYHQDLLAILSVADIYVGSSLHGAIASLAYGNKALIVANEELTKFSKFSGFLEQVDLQANLVANWRIARMALSRRGVEGILGVSNVHDHIARLESRWELIRNSLAEVRSQSNHDFVDDPTARMIASLYGI